IRVGATDLMFASVHEKSPNETSASFELREEPSGPSDVERVWGSDRYALRPDDGGDQKTAAAALRGLYKIGQTATTEKSLTRLLLRAAEAVREAVKADRVVVALYENDNLHPAVVLRGASDAPGAKIDVPRRIVLRSAVEGVSISTEYRHASETMP